MHFRARTYDRRLGRFLQKDPKLSIRIRRHYEYAANNPVSLVDPLGADPGDTEFAGLLGLVFGAGSDGQVNLRFDISLGARTELGSRVSAEFDVTIAVYNFGPGSRSNETWSYDVSAMGMVIAGGGEADELPLRLHNTLVESPFGNRFEHSFNYGFGPIYNSEIGFNPQYTLGARESKGAFTWHNDNPLSPLYLFTGVTDYGHTGGATVDVSLGEFGDFDESSGHSSGHPLLLGGADSKDSLRLSVGLDVFTAEPKKFGSFGGILRATNDRDLNTSRLSASIGSAQGDVGFGINLGGIPQDAVHGGLNFIGIETEYWDYPDPGEWDVFIRPTVRVR